MNHPQTAQTTSPQPTLNAADLHHFTGTVNWYRAPMSQKITMTDGIHHVAEHGGAIWLIVDIVAAQHDPAVAAEEFQVWTLKVKPDRTAELTFRDMYIIPFFKVELNREDGWSTETGKYIYWDKTSSSPGITSYLPIMKTDIILENNREGRCIIIDTKFANVLILGQHGSERFKTGHIH